MQIGYARVSTADQNLDLQRDALAGCDRVFREKTSGVRKRPQLAKAIAALGRGDVLVVWRLDRLGRSLSDLLGIVQQIEARGANLRSLDGKVDTTSASGRLVFHIFGALAQFERELLIERTRAGLDAAKRRGKPLGRPRAISSEQLRQFRKLVDAGESVRDVARVAGVSHATLYRELARQ